MVSTKGRYALRTMIDLAEHSEEGFVPLKEIAERQEISKKYLEIIVRDLVKAGLVRGESGKGGGYRLTRLPSEISAGEIIEATEGSFLAVACLDAGASCPKSGSCKTFPLWEEYNRMTKEFFFSKKLSDLV